MSLEELRGMRDSLRERDDKLAYWLRVLEGRIALLRRFDTSADILVTPLDPVAAALAGADGHAAYPDVPNRTPLRAPFSSVRRDSPDVPVEGLDAVWKVPHTAAETRHLLRRLVEVEQRVKAQRAELEGPLARATAELVSRYYHAPSTVLTDR